MKLIDTRKLRLTWKNGKEDYQAYWSKYNNYTSILFKQIVESNDQHKLAGLLPARNDSERHNFRTRHMFSVANKEEQTNKEV